MATPAVSPFLAIPSELSSEAKPAIIHLKRDQHQALVLKPESTLQTRFGNFPHSSILGLHPGSQVRASAAVPSLKEQRKRKRASNSNTTTETEGIQTAAGFLHVLNPTAELWTASLPHRTQVVYTPDSSYILHRLGAGPGTQIIEAGAGSGSFTHASVRAVYNGYEDGRELGEGEVKVEDNKKGKVWSFEFHEERAGKLREEISEHGLETLVQITHKDVCAEGFMVPSEEGATTSPRANAIFLDLPAPWLALPHLTRQEPSPLDQEKEIRLCTFSPCIEQVTRTCNKMRELGWVDIQMVEVQHQNMEVRRQLQRGYDEGAGPRSIAEALTRLKGVNDLRDQRKDAQIAQAHGEQASFAGLGFKKSNGRRKQETGEEGRIVSRMEPELKTHTSFLTFATLPRVWTEEQEKEAAEFVKEHVSKGVEPRVVGEKEKRWKGDEQESKRQRKKRERAEQKAAEGGEQAEGEVKEEAENMEIDG
ncbi:S-adenosyl-L-methionine-dependent methyltransferase [Pyronema domesticum]|uniref:tRNA (adenine(58)-N(1))-methyltransferase catalytic subunit TRM61 n=1 Tax=Pyronema omphalodes (strain CBS 100304) TaxID=1076935 RepID=U4LB94_PYROM|nr:S-adenosyl-L-methionine-dependent methyltransferase [Pyronema domesticum]CCX15876.1 Similar to tRNA (adenine(58)-N(1))-methyltransferase catalytic subunit trm61; acc. no. Q2U3W4 [Pyronema omphalodes CBS 100304]